MDGVSVVIPSMGRSNFLSCLVKSVEKQKCDVPVEIILVANQMADDLVWKRFNERYQFEGADKRSCVLRIERIHQAGVNFSRNQGLKLASYNLVFFIDDDCEMDDYLLLQKHYQLHQRFSDLFAVGGVYDISPGAGFFTRLYQDIQMNWLYRGLIAGRPKDRPDCRYLIGGHLSVKKDLAVKNNICFDEAIVYGGSELSFSQKSNLAGLPLQLHEMSVLHHTQESFFSLHRKIFKQGRGQALVSSEGLNVEDSDQKQSSFLISYFGWVFWFGFYFQRKNVLGFAVYLIKSAKNYLLYKKYKTLDTVNSILDSKKQRGDRL